MKVVQLAKYYYPEIGGIETVARQLNHALADHERVTVACASSGELAGEYVQEGVRVIKTKSQARWFRMPLSLSYLIIGWREMRSADVVIAHHPFPLVLPLLLITRKPVCVWYHADVQSRAQRLIENCIKPLLRRTLRKASVVMVSSSGLKMHARLLEPSANNVHVIPFPLRSPADILATPGSADKKKQTKTLNILSIGRLVSYKGYDIALRALAKLKDVSYRYTIVGSGPEQKSLQKLSRRLGIADRVTWAGRVSNLEKFFRSADIFLFPSRTTAEAFGIVQIEAMSFGLPVINTRLQSGVPEVSLDGVTGLTVQPESVSELAAALRRLMENESLRTDYGSRARQRATTVYSWGKFQNAIISVFQNNIHCPQENREIKPD